MDNPKDTYWHLPVNLADPTTRSVMVTPGSDPLPFITRAIRCDSGGSLDVRQMDGSETTLFFKDGETRAIRVTHILAASDSVQYIEALT